MILKLLKSYGISPPGTILPTVAKPIAEILIGRKIAVVVMSKKEKKEASHADK